MTIPTRNQTPRPILSSLCLFYFTTQSYLQNTTYSLYVSFSSIFFPARYFFSKKQSRNCLWLATIRESEVLKFLSYVLAIWLFIQQKLTKLNQDSWMWNWYIQFWILLQLWFQSLSQIHLFIYLFNFFKLNIILVIFISDTILVQYSDLALSYLAIDHPT